MDDLPIRCPLPRAAPRGFTAIELLVVIAILGILAALAAPSFIGLTERWRVRDASEAMVSTVYLARAEAMRRGGGIVVRKNPNRDGCSLAKTNADWGCGWFVFHDLNNNNRLDANEEVLRTYPGASGTDVTHTRGGEFFSVNRNGIVGSLNVRGFAISPNRTGISSPATRSVCVASGGRVRIIEEVSCQ
jgi:type IV fimbrial biogenesis protein FimT